MGLRALLIITSGLILLTGGCNSESSQRISQKQTSRQDILEVVSIEPESPQGLALGQRLQVHIGYQLNTAETAYIWARPYRNGNKVGGYGAHHLIPVSKKKNKTGFVTGWFFFESPAEINEIRVFKWPWKHRGTK